MSRCRRPSPSLMQPRRPKNKLKLPWLWIALAFASTALQAEKIVLHLKNGDRITGNLVAETTDTLTVVSDAFGAVQVPSAEIAKRDAVSNPPPLAAQTNLVAEPATAVIKPPPGPMKPANPEAMPIASTPSYWKHDLRFGLNLRYSTRDSQEFSANAKSIYGKAPFRHLFDASFRYGRLEGGLAANSLFGSEKTEFHLTPKSYIFGLTGGGYDKVRKIDLQYELGPGYGKELINRTNFVWKGEIGFNFQEQFRSDDTRSSVYSIRIAEIFAWRIWEKLTADAKIEFFPNLDEIGEYRMRLESTLRYPVSNLLSLNLDVIDLYDTQPARGIPQNDLQVRSSIGVTF